MKSLILSPEAIDKCLKFEFWRPRYWIINLNVFSFSRICKHWGIDRGWYEGKNDNPGRDLWTFTRSYITGVVLNAVYNCEL